MGGSALGLAVTAERAAAAQAATAPRFAVPSAKALVVQPVLLYRLYEPREATSWRPWGALHDESDVAGEIQRITEELTQMRAEAEFPLTVLPLARVSDAAQAEALKQTPADVQLIYAATGDHGTFHALLSQDRHNLVFVRHRSGPVYLWYEIVHPHMLRKAVDEFGEPNLRTEDVVVDEHAEVLWRLRALYALKNTVGARIVAIGGPGGWGQGGKAAPELARARWNMDIVDVSYEALGPRIIALRDDAAAMARFEKQAAEYLQLPRTRLEAAPEFVTGAFLLNELFEELMEEAGASAITVNECMTTIIPLSKTTACLTLTLINDAGKLAFCESDFVVIPSGFLLHHIASLPVFLHNPTYPHKGMITLAHCTAPRKMDGKHLEPARIQTHFESDYGAAPKVDMQVGQRVTVLNPDFAAERWMGFCGTILDNPDMDICRSQIDLAIDGDDKVLAEQMRGFHWMLAYGDHLKETGYALDKADIGWFNLTESSKS